MRRPLLSVSIAMLIIVFAFWHFSFAGGIITSCFFIIAFLFLIPVAELKIVSFVLMVALMLSASSIYIQNEKIIIETQNEEIECKFMVYEAVQQEESLYMSGKLEIVSCTTENCFTNFSFTLPSPLIVEAGDIVSFKAQAKFKPNSFLSPKLKLSNITNVKILENKYKLYSFFGGIRSKLNENALKISTGKESAVFPALLTGSKHFLSSEQKNILYDSGIAHICAVSGIHLCILFGFVNILFSFSAKYKAIIFIVVGIIVCGASGFSSSIVRAFIMAMIANMGMIVGKNTDSVTSLSLFMVLLSIFSPARLFELSTLYSYFSVMGIAVVCPFILKNLPHTFKKNKFLYKASEALAVSFSASLITLPLNLLFFGSFSAYGILLNVFIIPIVSIILIFLWIEAIVITVFGVHIPMLDFFLSKGAKLIFSSADFTVKLKPYAIGVHQNFAIIFSFVFCLVILVLILRKIEVKTIIDVSLMMLCSLFICISVDASLQKNNVYALLTEDLECCILIKNSKGIILGDVEDRFSYSQLRREMRRYNVKELQCSVISKNDSGSILLLNLLDDFKCNTVVSSDNSGKVFAKWAGLKRGEFYDSPVFPLGIETWVSGGEISFFFKEGTLLKTIDKCVIMSQGRVKEREGISIYRFEIKDKNDG